MTGRRRIIALLLLLLAGRIAPAGAAEGVPSEQAGGRPPVIDIGSKKFTESVILGHITAHLLRAEGLAVRHHAELGGSTLLFDALRSGELDAYPEYTGTLRQELLAGEDVTDAAALRAALAARGLRMTWPLGFDNAYAIAVRAETAERLALSTISDLRGHDALRFGLSNEFMDRADGWPGLSRRYGLSPRSVRGMDHDLAYRAIKAGRIDAVDVYTTDAEIERLKLRPLRDDRGFFPRYEAVLLYRADLERRAPAAIEAMRRLEGAIDGPRMRAMNARVKIDGASEAAVAARFVEQRFGLAVEAREEGRLGRLWRTTREHLLLVGVSLGAAILVAVPLGVAAQRWPALGQAILGVTGVALTIPALALLVFMIPAFGIGRPPAIAALFLYGLLPIVRNTHTGLRDIPLPVRESAEALGLSAWARLLHVELPMASRAILAGIKTAAVLNIGFATLGALIGAGGYGQPILTGIRLNDFALILEGAAPAALLAVLAHALFDAAERFIVPKGLRLQRPS